MKTSIKHFLLVGAGIAALLTSTSAKANDLLQVTVNTSSLISDSGDAPFWLDFNWYDNSSTAHTNNPVLLSNFNFGAGGSAIEGNNYYSGSNVTGDLTSSVTIGDVLNGNSVKVNEFSQEFTPGSTLTFTLSVPTTGQPGASDGGEEFTFDILDGSNSWASTNLLSTTAADGYDLLDVNVPSIDDPTPAFTVTTYQSTSPSPTGVTVAAVPEPATYGWMAVGAVALLAFGGKIRRARA